MIDRAQLAATANRRLNVGCGDFPLAYWTNLDADPGVRADIHATVPPLPFGDASLDEIYAGHFLEHLSFEDGAAFLAECYRCLAPGGKLGILVPDTFEVARRYVLGMPDKVEYPPETFHPVADLDEVCRMFLYSTVQVSPHKWSYDSRTLKRAMEAAGFVAFVEIDRYADLRIPVGEWYQCGWDAYKPAKGGSFQNDARAKGEGGRYA